MTYSIVLPKHHALLSAQIYTLKCADQAANSLNHYYFEKFQRLDFEVQSRRNIMSRVKSAISK
jgi:hypothetical protein